MERYLTQDDLNTLKSRLDYFGIAEEKYEVRNGIVYLNGVDAGSVVYLNSRSMEQLAVALDIARKGTGQ